MSIPNYLKAGLIALISFIAQTANAQTADQQAIGQQNDVVFKYVDKMPEFAEGDLSTWMSKKITYPEAARKNNIEGRVLVGFVVLSSGAVSTPIIRKSSGNDMLDAEAVRLVGAMPAWKPGLDKGIPVNVEFTLPITFKLTPAAKS